MHACMPGRPRSELRLGSWIGTQPPPQLPQSLLSSKAGKTPGKDRAFGEDRRENICRRAHSAAVGSLGAMFSLRFALALAPCLDGVWCPEVGLHFARSAHEMCGLRIPCWPYFRPADVRGEGGPGSGLGGGPEGRPRTNRARTRDISVDAGATRRRRLPRAGCASGKLTKLTVSLNQPVVAAPW